MPKQILILSVQLLILTVGADCYVLLSCWVTEYAHTIAVLKDT